MDFFSDLPRQLLNNSKRAHNTFKSTSLATQADDADADLFFELAVKKMTTQMSYLEHNRVNHLLLKNCFESFQ
ncbi:hypothetical protein cym2001_08980 [Pseudomonas sp. CYM-20-01]|jgi:hypothetical protein|uniref:hypothetical protein n=1 Tax=Pseudomonas sp. CYM-20-01 TaxID=2870750 RepID=UPI0020500EF8|nr:hypothetical protein [Pseudomonas sp. CYM-20-01]BDB17533.1 hypothetical protein cym2001_08980 [Pseudomonas sp. CYM-20-01]